MDLRTMTIRYALALVAAGLAGCAATAQGTSGASRGLQEHSTTDTAGNVFKGALLDGQWHGPLDISHANGNVTSGTMDRGRWTGEARFQGKSGTSCTGRLVHEGWDGLWTCRNPINEMTTYHVYQLGKELKSYTEFEALWAAGRYEEVFRLRGKKPLVGLNLKNEENGARVVVQKVQLHSPGFLAGVRDGDVVTAVDGRPVASSEEMVRAIVTAPFARTLRLDLRRDGRALTVDVVAGTIPRDFVDSDGRRVVSSEERLWAHYRTADSAEGYAKYLELVAESPYRASAAARLQEAAARERRRLQDWKAAGRAGEIAAYLNAHPGSPLRDDAINAAAEVLSAGRDRGAAYAAFADRCSHCLALLPPRFAILSVGPAGLTVGDTVRMRAQGIGAEVLAAKIESTGGEYRDFSFAEIEFLGEFGLPSSVVAAMIRSSHARAEKNLREENRKLQQENLALKQGAAQKVATPAADSARGAPASVVEECVKMAAALAACDQAGGFLKTGCRIMAQSSFQCPLPGYR